MLCNYELNKLLDIFTPGQPIGRRLPTRKLLHGKTSTHTHTHTHAQCLKTQFNKLKYIDWDHSSLPLILLDDAMSTASSYK